MICKLILLLLSECSWSLPGWRVLLRDYLAAPCSPAWERNCAYKSSCSGYYAMSASMRYCGRRYYLGAHKEHERGIWYLHCCDFRSVLKDIPLEILSINCWAVFHTHLSPESLAMADLPRHRPVECKTIDGTSLSAWLYEVDGLTPAPAIIMSHGVRLRFSLSRYL